MEGWSSEVLRDEEATERQLSYMAGKVTEVIETESCRQKNTIEKSYKAEK